MEFVPLAIFVSGWLIAQALDTHKYRTKEEMDEAATAYAEVLFWGIIIFLALGLFL